MRPVKTPHKNRYQPTAVDVEANCSGQIVSKTQRATRVSQNEPYDRKAVMPNMLFFFHSMMPAMTCAMPP